MAGSSTHGEQIVVVFMRADSDDAADVVERALRSRGFDVHRARSEGGPDVVFDYENARYLLTSLSGAPKRSGEDVPGGAPDPAARGIKVLLFPNAPAITDNTDVLALEWDIADEWLDRLVAAVRFVTAD
jgi:hypothetical protein